MIATKQQKASCRVPFAAGGEVESVILRAHHDAAWFVVPIVGPPAEREKL